jgi:hypothetical protein
MISALSVTHAQPRAASDSRTREVARSRVLAAYIGAGLLFMLVPGTFLGVLNLLQVSARESVSLVSAGWLQAHGHAQVFGWVGTFILGIGFYSIPKLQAGHRSTTALAWICWGLWTTGVAMRWTATVYDWHWRTLLPASAAFELIAFSLFLRSVSRHRPSEGGRQRARLEPWVKVVMSASLGFALTLVANLAAATYVAWRGESPALPHAINQRYLTLMAWGFLAPFVWGFSSKWLPVLLGLRPTRMARIGAGLGVNGAGVIATLAGLGSFATPLFAIGAALVASGLRIFEPAAHAPKTRGVHPSFPVFVRLAYVWLVVAAVLGVAAAIWDVSGGIWGASRHAFTVGFVSAMVFSIGQRVLPAFVGARLLWSPRLMFGGLILLTAGCTLRVTGEILAYQNYAAWAWSVLPVSAVIELAAVTLFALNMTATFLVDGGDGAVV